MPDEPTPSAGNTLAVTPAPSPALAATNTPPDTLAVDGNETISLEEARKLRKENQALRNRQKQIDDAEEQKRLAALSEAERANKQVQDLQQKYDIEHKQHINALVKLAAHSKGIVDPDIAALAIESQLEDDLSNLDKLLEDLIKNKPYLAKAAEPTTPAQQRPPATPAMNPGRSTIAPPNSLPQRIPRLTDQGMFKQ